MFQDNSERQRAYLAACRQWLMSNEGMAMPDRCGILLAQLDDLCQMAVNSLAALPGLADLARQLKDLCEKSGQSGASPASEKICLGIIGEACSGRSSFLNALVERRLLVVDARPGASAHPVYIENSPQNSLSAIYKDGSMRTFDLAPGDDSASVGESLEKRGTEIRNLRWRLDLATVPTDLVLLDLPAICSGRGAAEEQARQLAGQCDALLVLSRLTSPFSLDLLKAVAGLAGQKAADCFFVGTCADLLRPGQSARLEKYLLARLERFFGRKCVLAISSALLAQEDGASHWAEELRVFRKMLYERLGCHKNILNSSRKLGQAEKLALAMALIMEKAGEKTGLNIVADSRTVMTRQRRPENSHALVDGFLEAEEEKLSELLDSLLAEGRQTMLDFIGMQKSRDELNEFMKSGYQDCMGAFLKNFTEKLDGFFSDCGRRAAQIFKEDPCRTGTWPKSASQELTPLLSRHEADLKQIAGSFDLEENLKIGGGMGAGVALAVLVPGFGLLAGGVFALASGLAGMCWLTDLEKLRQKYLVKCGEFFDSFAELARKEAAMAQARMRATLMTKLTGHKDRLGVASAGSGGKQQGKNGLLLEYASLLRLFAAKLAECAAISGHKFEREDIESEKFD